MDVHYVSADIAHRFLLQQESQRGIELQEQAVHCIIYQCPRGYCTLGHGGWEDLQGNCKIRKKYIQKRKKNISLFFFVFDFLLWGW